MRYMLKVFTQDCSIGSFASCGWRHRITAPVLESPTHKIVSTTSLPKLGKAMAPIPKETGVSFFSSKMRVQQRQMGGWEMYGSKWAGGLRTPLTGTSCMHPRAPFWKANLLSRRRIFYLAVLCKPTWIGTRLYGQKSGILASHVPWKS